MAGTLLDKALERLYRRRTFGIRPGLEGIEALLSRLGHPEHSLPIIHVAGTNGKGSVCAMLCRRGIRTGLFTSPHLIRFNERYRVEGKCIDDGELASLLSEVEDAADLVASESGRELTFFEISTALAFLFFQRAGVQMAIIETGLGGRLDATNAAHPVLSVITHIGLDHQAYLGDSLEEIAAEKGGIIKPGIPVVVGEMKESCMAGIRQIAGEKKASLAYVPDRVQVSCLAADWRGQKVRIETAEADFPAFRLPLPGVHQAANAAVAVVVTQVLDQRGLISMDPSCVVNGLEEVQWPGRLQLLDENPPMILDCAHNESGMRSFLKTMKSLRNRRPMAAVIGVMEDKDTTGMLNQLAGEVACSWAVDLPMERAMAAADIASAAEARGMTCHTASLAGALEEARLWAAEEDGCVVICGSIFLAGAVLAERPPTA